MQIIFKVFLWSKSGIIVLIMTLLSVFFISGCNGKSTTSAFTAKCNEIYDTTAQCMDKVTGPGDVATLTACAQDQQASIIEAFKLLTEEQKKQKQSELSSFTNVTSADAKDFEKCDSKTTEEEKFLCKSKIGLNLAKEKFCDISSSKD